jgi:hypothetical protein
VATKKQRRRREKEQRHEYEIVYVDSEGQEVEVDESERATSRSGAKSEKKSQSGGRRPRTLEPPSWRRSIRRGAIFGPLFLAMILLLNGGRQSLAFSVVNTVILLAIFVPFSYFLDGLFWRSYQKRLGRSTGGSQSS